MRKEGAPSVPRDPVTTPPPRKTARINPVPTEDVVDEPVIQEEDEESIARRRRSGPAAAGASVNPKTDKKGKSRGSVHQLSHEPASPAQPGQKRRTPNVSASSPPSSTTKQKGKPPKKLEPKFKVEREVYIPPISVKVGDLARMVDVRLPNLQQRMRRMGMTEEQCHSDNYLQSEDASLVVMEFGMNPIVDEERSFDIYPE